MKGFVGGSIRNIGAYYTDGVGATVDGNGVITLNYLDGVILIPSESYAGSQRWIGAKAIIFNDFGLGTGSLYRALQFSTSATIRWFGIKDSATAGKYTISVIDNSAAPGVELVAGTTEYDYGTEYTLLVESNGTTISIFFGNLSTAEITISTADNLHGGANLTRFGLGLSGSSGTWTLEGPFVAQGDGDDSRPDPTTFAYVAMVPTGDSSYDNEYTHDESGAGATTKYDSVDEWGSTTVDDDTTFNENPSTASTTFRQAYTTSNSTLTKTAYCALIASRIRATVNNKQLGVALFQRDATNRDEGTAAAVTSNIYSYKRDPFPLDPSGNAWTQDAINNWEIGVRWTVPADAVTLRLSTIQGEIAGFDLQAASGHRRRGFAQII